MPDTSITKALGLATQYNPLNVTEGTFVQADDAVIRRENVIENRRGYASYATLSNTPTQLFEYAGRVLAHNSTSISYDNGSGTFNTYSGSFTAISGRKIHYRQANSNIYLTTSAGIQVLMEVTSPIVTSGDTNTSNQVTNLASTTSIVPGQQISGTGIPANTYVASLTGSTVTMSASSVSSLSGITLTFTPRARKAGVPRALGPSYALSGGSGFLSDTYQCAYRIVVKRTDQNNNIFFGYPSERLWVPNAAGGSRNVDLTVYLSSDNVAGDIIQVYRTKQIAGTTTDTAGDEEGLVYQQTLTQANILTGSFTVTDSVVDSLIGATIYTAPSQEGIGQANAEPPLAKDLALYKNAMFYANTQTKQRLFFSIISTTNLYNGGSYNRTIIIAGVTYTSKATETASAGEFKAFSTGTAAADIDNTARSLVAVINRYSSNTLVYAFYLSGPSDLPGQILIESRSVGGNSFTIMVGASATQGDIFPKPPVSPSTEIASTSSNSIQKNALYYSKINQLESVPLLNFLLIGPANTEILRVVALRDSLIVIKEEGVYRLNGDLPTSYSVVPLDLTVFCKAVNSVASLNNQVFMLSNQGVVAISDTSVQIISRDIEPSILPILINTSLANFTYGVGYESDHSYLLSTGTSSSDSVATAIFYYHALTRTWTKWTFAFTTGIVEPTTDKLFFTKDNSPVVFRERKSFSGSDYADPEVSITIVSISGSTVVFSSGTTPQAGWTISQNSTELKMESVVQSSSDWSAVMSDPPPSAWVAGAATMYPAVPCTVEWNAFTGGAPGFLKQLLDVKVLTDNIAGNDSSTSVAITFRTDIDNVKESVSATQDSSGWGSPWGSTPWGGLSSDSKYRSLPPAKKIYFRILNAGFIHNNAKERIAVCGWSQMFDMVSERSGS